MLTVTHSSISCFLNCHKRYYWEYDQCLTPMVEAWPLIDGKAIHLALEHYYKDYALFKDSLESLQKHVLTIIDTFYEEEGGEDEDTTAKHHAVITALFKGYSLIYPPNEFEEYNAEVRFEVKIGNPLLGEGYYMLAGKADAKIRKNGNPYIFETKTTSESSIARYCERLMLDGQPDTYLLGLNRMGYSAVGVMYNILRKPAHKQNAFESNEKFYKRIEKAVCEDSKLPKEERKYFFRETIYRSPLELQDYENDLKLITEDMSAYLPYKNRGRCKDYSGCPYWKLCTGSDCFTEYRKKSAPHEELET